MSLDSVSTAWITKPGTTELGLSKLRYPPASPFLFWKTRLILCLLVSVGGVGGPFNAGRVLPQSVAEQCRGVCSHSAVEANVKKNIGGFIRSKIAKLMSKTVLRSLNNISSSL